MEALSNYSFDYAFRLATMVHELGHLIGFAHTNWRELGESSEGIFNIPGVANTADPFSIMNTPEANINTFQNLSFNGLSVRDKKALSIMYPK